MACAYAQVIEDYVATLNFSDEQAEDLTTLLSLDSYRYANMTGGRASDGARSAVREHKSMGHEAYVAHWEQVRANDHR